MTATRTFDQLNPSMENIRADEHVNIKELAASILGVGLTVPLTITEDNVIIAGHRRYRAIGKLIDEGSLAADWEIPVYVRDINGDTAVPYMLVENLQREDINPIEEAEGYDLLLGTEGFKTQKDIAKRVGRSPSLVSSRLQLLKLPGWVADLVRAETLDLDIASALVPLAGNEEFLESLFLVSVDEDGQRSIGHTPNLWQVEDAVHVERNRKREAQIARWVESFGATAMTNYEEMRAADLALDHSSRFEVKTKADVEAVVTKGNSYMISIPWHDRSPMLTLLKPAPEEETTDHQQTDTKRREKEKRAKKKARMAFWAETIQGPPPTAKAYNELLEAWVIEKRGHDAKTPARLLGLTSEQIPTNSEGKPDFGAALQVELSAGGARTKRAVMAYIIADLESWPMDTYSDKTAPSKIGGFPQINRVIRVVLDLYRLNYRSQTLTKKKEAAK